MQDILLLRAVLNNSLDALEAAYGSKSVPFPSLDAPFVPNTDSELLSTDPDVSAIIDKIVAASYQLLCTVRHPFLNLADAASGVSHLHTLLKHEFMSGMNSTIFLPAFALQRSLTSPKFLTLPDKKGFVQMKSHPKPI
jgi:hypothetical protein